MTWTAVVSRTTGWSSSLNGTRMPWAYGPEVLARWKELAALHQRALPLIRRLWRSGRRTGMPPTRPLWLSAPESPGAHDEAQQWLLGPGKWRTFHMWTSVLSSPEGYALAQTQPSPEMLTATPEGAKGAGDEAASERRRKASRRPRA